MSKAKKYVICLIGVFFLMLFLLAHEIGGCLSVLASSCENADEYLQSIGQGVAVAPQMYANAYALTDAENGRMLLGKNEDQFMANASTTKIMTCILLLENLDENEIVTVSPYAASMPKVKLYLKAGETYRVGDLIYSLMLESHNDTAVALAEYCAERVGFAQHVVFADSKEKVAYFSKMMNQKAKEIGCRDTYFITPNGLDEILCIKEKNGEESITKCHGTTAIDLARIMAYCVCKSGQKERFVEICRKKQYIFSANNRTFILNNKNALLSILPDTAVCGKTGFTNKAGYCYVGCLRTMDHNFTFSLLGCGWPGNKQYKWRDSVALENYIKDNLVVCDYENLIEALKGKIPEKVTVSEGRGENPFVRCDIPILFSEAEEKNGKHSVVLHKNEKLTYRTRMESCLPAPVERGTIVGEIQILLGDEILWQGHAKTAKNVEEIKLDWIFRYLCQQILF